MTAMTETLELWNIMINWQPFVIGSYAGLIGVTAGVRLLTR